MASIRTAGLTKDFGDLRAVNAINLDLPEGGVAGFVGPNGAGKSTTIRMLLGLIAPTGGGGEVLGCPISRPAAYLHRVGALIETPAYHPTLTGRANLQVTSDGTRRPAGVAPAVETALAVPFDNGQAPACLTYSPFIRANARLGGHPSSQSADPAGESLQVSAHIGIVDQNRWGRGHRQGVAGSNPVSPTV